MGSMAEEPQDEQDRGCTHTQLQNHAGLMDKSRSIQNPGEVSCAGRLGVCKWQKAKREQVFFCDKKDQIRGWTEEAAGMSALDHGS